MSTNATSTTPGDKVLATDPAIGRTYIGTVTTLHINQDTDLADAFDLLTV